jgi:MFS family permease
MNTTAVDERLDTGQRMLAVGLVLGVSLVGFEVTALTTVLPTVTDELGGDSLYGVCLAVYTLAGMVSLVIAGRAADRRGPAFVMTASLAVFVVGLVVSGVAPDMWTVVSRRWPTCSSSAPSRCRATP